jgi:hypothetical protein
LFIYFYICFAIKTDYCKFWDHSAELWWIGCLNWEVNVSLNFCSVCRLKLKEGQGVRVGTGCSTAAFVIGFAAVIIFWEARVSL